MILSPSELRPERERRGLSRPALARLCDVSAGVIGRIETSGKASCTTMQALSDALIGTVKAEDVHFWRERAASNEAQKRQHFRLNADNQTETSDSRAVAGMAGEWAHEFISDTSSRVWARRDLKTGNIVAEVWGHQWSVFRGDLVPTPSPEDAFIAADSALIAARWDVAAPKDALRAGGAK